MDVPVDVDRQLAGQDVQGLLEGMDVPAEPTAGGERADRGLGVHGALVRTDDPEAAEAHRR